MKNYFAQKKQLRESALDTIQKINHIAAVLSDLSDAAAASAGTFDADTLKNFMENMDKIASSPDLTTAYYQQVSRQAHEQSSRV